MTTKTMYNNIDAIFPLGISHVVPFPLHLLVDVYTCR